MCYTSSEGSKCIALLSMIHSHEGFEYGQRRASETAGTFWLYCKNPKPVPLHFVLCCSYVLSVCTMSESISFFLFFFVILHSGSIMARTLTHADGLVFSLPFRDLNWSHIHRWTFVNVCFRHAPRECSPSSKCRSGNRILIA
jgi:hypothetical protein